ncbi:hypothetical protein D918_05514 [Trichuris suis]|nr:hypothetical protein D918_05514 [Trichuris suis]
MASLYCGMEASSSEVLKNESQVASPACSASGYFLKIDSQHQLGIANSSSSPSRVHSNVMWQLCSAEPNDSQDQHLQRDGSRYPVVTANVSGSL